MSSTYPTEPITSEPVIVASPSRKDSESSEYLPETIESRLQTLENLVLPPKLIQSRTPSPSQPRRRLSRSRSREEIRIRERYHSPQREELTTFTNSASLQEFLTKTDSFSDALVEIQSGPGRMNTHMIHLTAVPTHQAELDKISWMFTTGTEDCWVQKPGGRETLRFDLPGGPARGCRGRAEIYEDRYDRYDQFEDRFQRGVTPLVKLGEIFTTLFKDGGDENVKFLAVIQGKGTSGWLKLLTSYSKKGAMVDLFHELVNGYSVLFVGAVLSDVDLSNIWKLAGTKDEFVFKKVGDVEEARAVQDGVVGIIC